MKKKKKSLKDKYENFIEKISKANKDSFGSGPLDCCELNKDKKKSRP
ncbi:hypothetical protein LQU94_06015 [Peptoniphilus sp. KCTC 25270]|nr:LDCC motif putative metal-binding protein [Peptoniphilus sp. KCTC 25270]MCD1147665.1 hypothetical protein [Peptoniphilus sp. KCTC 25270]